MNKEDYVSLEVAKLLKEKGFNEPVLSQYSKCGSVWNCYEPENFNESTGCFSRPTLYEAQKWLRNKHNIHLVTQCVCYHKPTQHYDYKCEVFSLDSSRGYIAADIRSTYEEALNLGILEALKRIWL